MKRFATCLLWIFFSIHSLFAQHTHCSQARRMATLEQDNPALSPAHVARLKKYDISFYHLNLNVERNSSYLSGNVLIQAKAISRLDTFSFELHDSLQIDSVRINGQTYLQTVRTGVEANVVLTNAVLAGESVRATIYYKGKSDGQVIPGYTSMGLLTARSSTYGNEVAWTYGVPNGAARWMPCKQMNSDKADSVFLYITTSAENTVAANGLLKRVVDLPGNKKRFEWESRYPTAYYLIALTVAKFQEYNLYAHPAGLSDSILIQNFLYDNPLALSQNKANINMSAQYLEYFSQLFGMYPFYKEKFGYCMAELGGGMENQTMVQMQGFPASVVAHELAHQWFGDHVTVGQWGDCFLSEAFATYSEYLMAERFNPAGTLTILSNSQAAVKAQPGGSVFVQDITDAAKVFNSRLVYKKGSLMLHTLRFEINNDSLFFSILKEYQSRYAFSTAIFTQFKEIIEQKTGRSFTQFFNQWYYGEGYPIYDAVWNQKAGKLLMSIQHKGSMPQITPLYITPLEISVQRTGGKPDTILRINIQTNTQTFEIPFSDEIYRIRIDPKKWVLCSVNSIIQDSSFTVSKEEMTGKMQSIVLYPNPSEDNVQLHTSFVASQAEVLLYDGNGNLIRQGFVELPDGKIHLRDLPAATYFCKVMVNGQEFNSRFVKTGR